MKKKILSVILTTAMVATVVAGCGGGGTETEAPTSAATEATTDAPADETVAPEADTTEADAAETESAEAGDSEAAETEAGSDAAAGEEADGEVVANEAYHFEIVSKGFQHQFWRAVLQGAEEEAEALGVTMNFVGPNSESDIADQVQMLNSAVNAGPAAIALAALDTNASMDGINQAMSAGIPIIGFDSGVPDAPEGAILANASTDNYAAGELAATSSYDAIKAKMDAAEGPVRIGVMNQDATGESIISRGLGFIDKIAELCEADGKVVTVEGNDKFVTDSKVEPKDGADVILEVLVPSQVTSELSAIDCQTLLNKDDTIAIYGSNQHSGEGMVTGNENLQKFGTGDDQVIGIAFDSGAVIKAAVADGTFIGGVTQAPLSMGKTMVQLCVKAANGEPVSDVDTGCQWYTAENMEDPEVAPNLYD